MTVDRYVGLVVLLSNCSSTRRSCCYIFAIASKERTNHSSQTRDVDCADTLVSSCLKHGDKASVDTVDGGDLGVWSGALDPCPAVGTLNIRAPQSLHRYLRFQKHLLCFFFNCKM